QVGAVATPGAFIVRSAPAWWNRNAILIMDDAADPTIQVDRGFGRPYRKSSACFHGCLRSKPEGESSSPRGPRPPRARRLPLGLGPKVIFHVQCPAARTRHHLLARPKPGPSDRGAGHLPAARSGRNGCGTVGTTRGRRGGHARLANQGGLAAPGLAGR